MVVPHMADTGSHGNTTGKASRVVGPPALRPSWVAVSALGWFVYRRYPFHAMNIPATTSIAKLINVVKIGGSGRGSPIRWMPNALLLMQKGLPLHLHGQRVPMKQHPSNVFGLRRRRHTPTVGPRKHAHAFNRVIG